MKKKILASLLFVTSLVGCGKIESGNTEPTTGKGTSTADTAKTYTLKEALDELKNPSSRYSLYSGKYENDSYFEVDNATDEITFGPHYYTKNALLGNTGDYNTETGYLEENGGVSSYTYDFESDVLTRSELLTDEEGNQITSLDQVAPSFNGVDASSIEVVDNALDFKGQKKSVLALLDLFNISNTALFYLESFKMEFLGTHVMNNLIFTAKINMQLSLIHI